VYIRSYLGILELEKQAILARDRVPNLSNPVSGASDLDDILLHLHAGKHTRYDAILTFAFFLLLCRSTREVGLMFSALGMR
jgi:hypothetical protein